MSQRALISLMKRIFMMGNNEENTGKSTSRGKLPKNSNIVVRIDEEETTMFDYQDDAIESLEVLKGRGENYRTLVVVPTGGGKTRIAVKYLLKNVLSKNGGKVLWMCERLSLLTQAHESFTKLATTGNLKDSSISEITAHVFSSEDTSFKEVKDTQNMQMIFATKQTLCKMFGFESITKDTKSEENKTKNTKKRKNKPIITKGKIDDSFEKWLDSAESLTVIIDEAHHAVGDDYRNIIRAINSVRDGKSVHFIGLTATPKNTGETGIEEVFLHGVEKKIENGREIRKASDKTCYACRVSINELVAKEYLSKPFLAHVDVSLDEEALLDKIVETYQAGVSALVLKTASGTEETSKKKIEDKKDEKDNKKVEGGNSFGQTVIFVQKREIAIKLWEKFRNKDVDCGLSISVDDTISNLAENLLQDYLRDKSNSERIVQCYEERYSHNKLPVIISVDKFKEGVDVPKTQTVFIARDTTTEISVTQMVGRALRGVQQGGTSEACLVEFGDGQLDKVLWEVPEINFKGKKLKDALKKKIKIESFNIKEEYGITEESIGDINVSTTYCENVVTLIQGRFDREILQIIHDEGMEVAVSNALINMEIPIGYRQYGQRYLLVWEKTEDWCSKISTALKGMPKDIIKKLWNDCNYSSLSLKRKVLYANKKYSELYKLYESVSKTSLSPLFWNYLYTILFYLQEVKSGGKRWLGTIPELMRFIDMNQPEIQNYVQQIMSAKENENIDETIDSLWDSRSESLEISEVYFKAYLKQFALKYEAIAQEAENDGYFRIRLYRDGRKRENLVKLLRLILKGAVNNETVKKDFDFYDVFGGTGTVTTSVRDVVGKGARHYNEYDAVLCRVLAILQRYNNIAVDDFIKNYGSFHNGWLDIIQANKPTDIDDKINFLNEFFRIIGADEEVQVDKNRVENKYAEKQAKIDDRVTDFKNFEGIKPDKNGRKFKYEEMKQKYLVQRYKNLISLQTVLKEKEVQDVVQTYLALYVTFTDYMKKLQTDEYATIRENWKKEINSRKVAKKSTDKLLLNAFIFVYSFSSRCTSKPSEAGVDHKGIAHFKKLYEKNPTWLHEFAERLQDVKMTCKSFEDILTINNKQSSDSEVYYLDPPYFLTNQYDCVFTDEQHLTMLKWLRETERKWIFSCKSTTTNDTLKERISKEEIQIKRLGSNGEVSLEEYYKLLIYDEKREIKGKVTEVSADMTKPTNKELYVYYADPLEDNAYEIMISNIALNFEDKNNSFKSNGVKCVDFGYFLDYIVDVDSKKQKEEKLGV